MDNRISAHWSKTKSTTYCHHHDHCTVNSRVPSLCWADCARHSAVLCLVTQSCLTLCDPVDCSLLGSSVHGILQARILELLPFPSPGDLPEPGTEPRSPTLQVDSLLSEPLGEALKSASVQFSSVAQWCPTLCHPMNRSTPGLPVHHQLPEFTQTHVHRVNDAIQPSHPLLSPSPPAPNPSQHQSLFQR